MNINLLKLKDIVKNYEIVEQEFEFAGIKGSAELFGWQIIFFRKKEDPNSTVAISFNEIESNELINISNIILQYIGVDVRFDDNLEKINSIYGIADFVDYLYEDMIRYYYNISSQLLIVFGIKNEKISSLEIVVDENLIKQINSVNMY